MGFEARAKLGCQLSSLSRMARRSRQVANRHPPMLETLKTCILLLTISSPIATSTMLDTEHWVLDVTFKSAPNMFYQLFTFQGIFPDNWHLPLFYGLLSGKTTLLYQDLFQELNIWGPYQPHSILMDYDIYY